MQKDIFLRACLLNCFTKEGLKTKISYSSFNITYMYVYAWVALGKVPIGLQTIDLNVPLHAILIKILSIMKYKIPGTWQAFILWSLSIVNKQYWHKILTIEVIQ